MPDIVKKAVAAFFLLRRCLEHRGQLFPGFRELLLVGLYSLPDLIGSKLVGFGEYDGKDTLGNNETILVLLK